MIGAAVDVCEACTELRDLRLDGVVVSAPVMGLAECFAKLPTIPVACAFRRCAARARCQKLVVWEAPAEPVGSRSSHSPAGSRKAPRDDQGYHPAASAALTPRSQLRECCETTRDSDAKEAPRERNELSDDAVVTWRDEPSALERGTQNPKCLNRPNPPTLPESNALREAISAE